MSAIIEYCTTNYMAMLGAFYTIATVIANITPTDKDNNLLEKFGGIADRFGLKLKGK